MEEKTVKKLQKGEAVGVSATIFCAVAAAYFIVCYTIAKTQNIYVLELTALISAPILIVLGATVGAVCNIKYGGALEKLINDYVRGVCIENAALFHPERNSLSFYINVENTAINLQVNGYKEKITFDFSVFGKLSLAKKITALTAVENRISATFCKLWERGAKYTEVCFAEREGTRRKSGKTVFVIKDGHPDTKTYKQYLKNK